MWIFEGPYFPAFTFVPLPPPSSPIGLKSALDTDCRNGVKDPPRASASPTLSWAFIFGMTGGRLAPHPLPWYQCTGLPIGPFTLDPRVLCPVDTVSSYRSHVGLDTDCRNGVQTFEDRISVVTVSSLRPRLHPPIALGLTSP